MKVEGLGKVFVYRICASLVWLTAFILAGLTVLSGSASLFLVAILVALFVGIYFTVVFKLKEYQVLIAKDSSREVELSKELVFRQLLWSIVTGLCNLVPIAILLIAVQAGITAIFGTTIGSVIGGIISSIGILLFRLPLTVNNNNRVLFTGEYRVFCGPKSIQHVYATLDKRVSKLIIGVGIVYSIGSSLSMGPGMTYAGGVPTTALVIFVVLTFLIAAIFEVYTSSLLLVKSSECYKR